MTSLQRMRPVWLLAAVLLFSACGGPWGPIPGGALSGAEIACGSTFPTDLQEVEIEVRPSDPYSVTIWNVVVDGTLYLSADFLNPGKRWPYFLEEDERLRVRVGGLVHACRGIRVTDTDRIQRLREAAARKYDLAEDGMAASVEVWWFRVGRR